MTFALLLFVSIGVWASTFINYLPIVEETGVTRTAFAFNQKRNGVGLGATKNSAFETMLATTLLKVDKMGIYSLPKPLVHKDEDKISLADSTGLATAKVVLNELSPDVLNIGHDFQTVSGERNYAILESENNLYLFHFP